MRGVRGAAEPRRRRGSAPPLGSARPSGVLGSAPASRELGSALLGSASLGSAPAAPALEAAGAPSRFDSRRAAPEPSGAGGAAEPRPEGPVPSEAEPSGPAGAAAPGAPRALRGTKPRPPKQPGNTHRVAHAFGDHHAGSLERGERGRAVAEASAAGGVHRPAEGQGEP